VVLDFVLYRLKPESFELLILGGIRIVAPTSAFREIEYLE
jgi:hypothetical protein